ncbi:MAG: hypothetical protein EXR33_11075 [Betaproteobacteria bacterium]|nr:hypothetical protein [Betaproteobacteria bacterium]
MAEANALAAAREREAQSGKFLAEAQARAAAQSNARLAAEAEAVRLEKERMRLVADAARESKERRRAEKRAEKPEASANGRWLVAGAIAVAGIFAALGLYETTGKAPSGIGTIFQLKLDRNLESFAQRLKEEPKQ